MLNVKLKMYKNNSWKKIMCKQIVGKSGRGRPGREWFWKFGHTRTGGWGGLKIRYFGVNPL